MSAPRIIAQGVPNQIVSYPGWNLPTRVRVVADLAGGAATLRAADSSPGVAISNGAGGVFDVTFPSCRRMADINPQVHSQTPGTAANRFFGVVDVSTTNTNPTTGKLRVVTASTAGAAIPNDTQVFDLSFWADFG